MSQTLRQCAFMLLVLMSNRGELLAATAADDLWTQLATGGQVVLLRHAIAPGTGDPPTFKLGDCSTQRNLSDAGRQQARRIGAAFRRHGVNIDKVYTSQWCRCQDTAELLKLGPVEPLPLLNSFFDNRSAGKAQTAALEEFLTTKFFAGVVILVTHQVNITALTDIFPSSGEAVVVEVPESKNIRVLGRLSVAPE
jgi:phosphohistidine phosphatase SixA